MIDQLLEATVVGSFTRPGFAMRSRGFEPLPSLAGKTVVVTGGSSGIGLAAGRRLSALGARVVIAGRDEARLRHAAATVGALGGEVVTVAADLSRLDEVRRLAAELDTLDGSLDVLVNNVSVLSPRYAITEDGLERTLATNLVGPFLLTNLVAPRLVASGSGRIVTVSSGGMYTQRLDIAGLEVGEGHHRGSVAYARTKRAQVVLTELWAERLRSHGVVAHAMHPGWVDTPGLAASLPVFRTLMLPLLRDADQGADTIAYLAAAAEPGRRSGLFWHDRRPRSTHRLAGTKAGDAQRFELWDRLESLSDWSAPIGWPGHG